jgi:hypothetical protein
MKKHSFYSLMRKDGKTAAVLQNGYSDGTFYFYSTGERYKTWYAIHPLFGMSVAYGYSRKECAEKAHSPDLIKKIAEHTAKRGESLAAAFEKAIQEAKAAGEGANT